MINRFDWRLSSGCLSKGIFTGKYLAVWPVYIVGDDPGKLVFTVAVDDASLIPQGVAQAEAVSEESSSRRMYVTAVTRKRLHQQAFRIRVLHAYREQCSFCRLRHEQLLDAAHIIPDSEPEGIPSINNGIALCKLHHAAFDSFIIGITPDYELKVRPDVLREHDGPMLLYGLKNLSGQKIQLPRSRSSYPSQDLLKQKFEQFRQAI